jgi:hypothetical protein
MAGRKELWQELYEAALLETNLEEMQPRVQAAKAAIDARLHELQLDHGGTSEQRQALSDALAGLRVLGREIKGRESKRGDVASDQISD